MKEKLTPKSTKVMLVVTFVSCILAMLIMTLLVYVYIGSSVGGEITR